MAAQPGTAPAPDGAEQALRYFLGPLKNALQGDDVTDVVVNRPQEIGVARNRLWEWSRDERLTPTWLESLARQLADFSRQDITEANPTCSATMPDGERVQIVKPPCVVNGQFSLTIRNPPKRTWSTRELEAKELFSDAATQGQAKSGDGLRELYRSRKWREFLEAAVVARRNIVISGATGSGKTTLARALMCHIPAHERLITGEDTFELLDIPLRNKVHMLYPKEIGQAVAKVRPKTLMEAALRMRPDRVIFPELRDGSAYYFLRAVASGHPGVITTIHANNCAMAWEVLTLLVRESEGGATLERQDIKTLLRQTIDIVVQMAWRPEGPRLVEIEFNDPVGRAELPGN